MIRNPILRGFCPDPSIVRAGDDYYIATSTFEWWPGVRLFHSKDLKHWEQIPSPLTRKSQLNLLGDPNSGGVWAPDLSYDGKRFFLVYTDVKTKKGRWYNTHNYMVYTDDICGKWSEPIYYNSIGFDPSLFHDNDGRKYLINMINGFKGVLVQELDRESYEPIGERRLVYSGSGLGCTEGPHMYHIGEWYYILVAEGGTGYDHCVTMARSKSVWGPFETAPDNPILTSNRSDMDALQKCGHADFTDTPDGEWYMVHLASRPLAGEKWCTLGRETAIQKMCWVDGWLRLSCGGRFAQNETEEPVLSKHPYDLSEANAQSSDNETSFFDDFSEETFNVRYSSPRHSFSEFASLTERRGYLRIHAHESMNSLHDVSLLAVRQEEAEFVATTSLEAAPYCSEQLAGLTYCYDSLNFYVAALTCDDRGRRYLTLLMSDKGEIKELTEPVYLDSESYGLKGELPSWSALTNGLKTSNVSFKVETSGDGTKARFSYDVNDQNEWRLLGDEVSTSILTDEYCRGFTGAHVGLYAHDLSGFSFVADFRCFEMKTRL